MQNIRALLRESGDFCIRKCKFSFIFTLCSEPFVSSERKGKGVTEWHLKIASSLLVSFAHIRAPALPKLTEATSFGRIFLLGCLGLMSHYLQDGSQTLFSNTHQLWRAAERSRKKIPG